MSDPNLHWDGTRWLRWDGIRWVDAETAVVPPQPPSMPGIEPGTGGYGPVPPGPRKSRTTLILIIVAVALVVLLLVAVGVIVVMSRGSQPTPTPSPTPAPTSASPTPSVTSPTPAALYTMYFVKAEAGGGAYAAGVKTRGRQASGWAATLRTDDLTCFNGEVADGKLTGTLVTPSLEGGPPATQPFSWRVSGEGESLRLLEIGSVTPLREVPLATVNEYAGLAPDDSWEPLFDRCAGLTGGLR